MLKLQEDDLLMDLATRKVVRGGLPLAGLRDRAQEDLQVLGDDLVEHGVRGITRPVDRSLETHGPPGGIKTPTGTMLRERYTEQGGEGGGRTAAGGASTFQHGF